MGSFYPHREQRSQARGVGERWRAGQVGAESDRPADPPGQAFRIAGTDDLTFSYLQSRSRGLLFPLFTSGSACGCWPALALAAWTAWASARAALCVQVERCGRFARAVGRAGVLPTHGPGCSVGSGQTASCRPGSGAAWERCPAPLPGRRRAGWSQRCSVAAPSRCSAGSRRQCSGAAAGQQQLDHPGPTLLPHVAPRCPPCRGGRRCRHGR